MPPVSLGLGIVLILMGVGFYFGTGTEVDGVLQRPVTALIPAFFGAGFAVLGAIGLMGDKARKHSMHVAALLGLLGCLVPGYMAMKAVINGIEKPMATIEQAIMSAACALFVFLCVRSFIEARRARAARGE
jgi:hypothetical protein